MSSLKPKYVRTSLFRYDQFNKKSKNVNVRWRRRGWIRKTRLQIEFNLLHFNKFTRWLYANIFSIVFRSVDSNRFILIIQLLLDCINCAYYYYLFIQKSTHISWWMNSLLISKWNICFVRKSRARSTYT